MKFNRKGLLASTAQKYHRHYVAEIAYKIHKGLHLSVLLPSMLPAYPLILNLYEILDFREREYVVVESQKDVVYINDLLTSMRRENSCIYPIAYDQFISKTPNSGCIVLFNLNQEMRLKLNAVLSVKKEQKIITIGNLDKCVVNEDNYTFYEMHSNRILDELYRMTLSENKPHGMIFIVDSILDVRDIMFANPSEKPQIAKQLSDVAAVYEQDSKQDGLSVISKHSVELLREHSLAVNELSDQLDLMKTLVLSIGMQPDDLEEGLNRVKNLKRIYVSRIEAEGDIKIKEKIISELENKISDLSVTLTQRVLTEQNTRSYETIIANMLSKPVWNKLSNRSREYLISARMTYDALVQMNYESVDYSGVCLQITKTLDEELASRFYKDYKLYLEKKYPISTSLSRWPNAMKNRDGMKPLDENEFTLGTICFVLGVKGNGVVVNNYSFREAVNYAMDNLYEQGLSRKEIEQKLKNIAVYTDKVRREYRNPSAHRSAITYVTATECMDYLIEHYRKLKEILEYMRK